MDDRRVAEYFVVAGLPEAREPLDDFCRDRGTPGGGVGTTTCPRIAPITDVAVIFPSLGEEVPEGFAAVWTTPTGHPANLNHGSLRSASVFLCYRRGFDRPPLVDIGVYDEGGKENPMLDVQVVTQTAGGRAANVSNSGSRMYVTYRRAAASDPCSILVVTDVCVILQNKDERPPRTFCKIQTNLNKGLLGSDVFLCYKKSMNRANSLAYKPGTLSRFPLTDQDTFPLPESVPLFCLPMGATVECWPAAAQRPPPVFSTFVLSVFASEDVEKVYGTAVSFYEDLDPGDVSRDDQERLGAAAAARRLHVAKSLCILSRWPFFEPFRRFLEFLYRMSLGGPHPVPLERHVARFLQEVPFPSPQRPRILVQLDHETTVALAQPEDSPLPLSGASFKELLRNLGPDNSMSLLLYALMEQKILVHSLRPDVLTSVAEAISMFIFPFRWQCPYIPLCPLGLSDVLSAPMPFIVGVDSRYFDLYDPPPDVFCIDLDTVAATSCEDRKHLSVKLLPKKPARALRHALGALYERIHRTPPPPQTQARPDAPIDLDFNIRKREGQMETEIQDAFLRFMASTLRGFRSFLLPLTRAPSVGCTDPSALFDLHGFLKSRDRSHVRFYQQLMQTQMWTRFIEERSFVTDKDASLAFFDDCTDKVHDAADSATVRLLEPDDAHQSSERTVFVPPPDGAGRSYTYSGVPKLDPSLFHAARLVTSSAAALGGGRASPAPSSPLARRTKQEIRSAQRLAKKQSERPDQWALCLLSSGFSLWFVHLPAYVKLQRRKSGALATAFQLLGRMQSACGGGAGVDEVCYRVLMQLCGQYAEPILAIKIYAAMKRHGVVPNAITYGYYNKAVLENKWPSFNRRSGALWRKLRNVIVGVAQFKRNAAHQRPSSFSESDAASSSECGDATLVIGASAPNRFTNACADRNSLGGASDVGYGSLNPEDRRSSSSINSADAGGLCAGNTKLKSVARRLRYSSAAAEEEERGRPGSIVKNAALSSSGGERLKNVSSAVDSAAGLLIPGHFLCDDVFTTSDSAASNRRRRWRRRHRSCDSEDSAWSADRRASADMIRSFSFASDARIVSRLNGAALPTSTSTSKLTPVTQDDPLGAFTPTAPITAPPRTLSAPGLVRGDPKRHSVTLGRSMVVSGSGPWVAKSATFCADRRAEKDRAPLPMLHRSSTVPDATRLVGATTPLSPLRTQLATLTARFQSLGAGGSRRSDIGALLGGFHGLKSAASSVASKLSEIKEAITTTSFSAGGAPSSDALPKPFEMERKLHYDDEEQLPVGGGHPPEVRQTIFPTTPACSSRRRVVDVAMSTCSRCHACAALLYDEEIMANWTPEDSNLNTRCAFCDSKVVPLLTVTIRDCSGADVVAEPDQPISVPYLSPIVLRKELETVLEHEGDECLTRSEFVDDHPIIFWNLLWYCKRIDAPTHLQHLWLRSKVDGCAPEVSVRCLWDNPELHDKMAPPMYAAAASEESSLIHALLTEEPAGRPLGKGVVEQIVFDISRNELSGPLKLLLQRLLKSGSAAQRHPSIYRDILFLAVVCFGRANVHLRNFDRKYREAFTKLTTHQMVLRRQDYPLSNGAVVCREFFTPLEL